MHAIEEISVDETNQCLKEFHKMTQKACHLTLLCCHMNSHVCNNKHDSEADDDDTCVSSNVEESNSEDDVDDTGNVHP